MNLSVIEDAIVLEQSTDLHIARLLLLLRFHGVRGPRPLDGMTKLAKYDFLLRYPSMLERALISLQQPTARAGVADYERQNIESKMIRFRYGPWDFRYPKWLSIMGARGLALLAPKGRSVIVTLSDAGVRAADTLGASDEFKVLADRSSLIYRFFGTMSPSRLKEFVYSIAPELRTMRWGEEIA